MTNSRYVCCICAFCQVSTGQTAKGRYEVPARRSVHDPDLALKFSNVLEFILVLRQNKIVFCKFKIALIVTVDI